jgi:hypothetical protein
MADTKKDYSEIGIEQDGDIIFCTVAKYKLFLNYGKIGVDAYLLYSHLMFTARLQKTNSVWATNKYIREGLNWGKERLLKAKNLLYDLDLICQKQGKKENGDFDKSYLIVKTSASLLEFSNNNDGGLDTGGRETRLPDLDHKFFNNKDKFFNNKENIYYTPEIKELFEFWIKVGCSNHKESVVIREIKKKHLDIFKDYSVDEIKKMIADYILITKSDKYWYNYWFSFWDFIGHGYKKFLPELKPLESMKIIKGKTELTRAERERRIENLSK